MQQAAAPAAAVAKPETPQPVQKPPIPSEYEIVQKVLDELKDRCNCTANNPVSLLKNSHNAGCELEIIPRMLF